MSSSIKEAVQRKLSLVSKLQMLNKATNDDPTPTPGHMYEEICKITFTSVGACSELEDYLLKKLNKKSPHTKAKVLKILKYLIEKGHHGFRQDLQRRTDSIRNAMSFRGSADPLHGDTFNALVRKNAKDLMEVVFNEPEDSGQRRAPGQRPSSISRDGFGNTSPKIGRSNYNSGAGSDSRTGFGSDSMRNSGSVPSGGSYNSGAVGTNGKKMWGYGNTPVEPESKSFMNKVKSTINKVAEKIPDSITGASERREREAMATMNRQAEMESSFRAGGGLNAQHSYGSSSSTANVGQSAFAFKNQPAVAQPTVTKDTGYEKRLVEEITAPGGVRIAPQPAALATFVGKCRTLDCHKIADLLTGQVTAADTDRGVLRCLYVVKALAESDIIGIDDCLQCMKPTLQQLTQDKNSGVRDKSALILRRIAAEPNTVAAAAAPASSGNILDMSAPAPSSEPAATGLFAGMQTAAAPTSAAPQATAPSAATTAPAAAGGSMFAGMNMGGAAPDVAAAPTSSASSGLEDLMGGLVTGGPAAGPAAAPGGVGAVNLLGDMQETTQPASFDPLADLMGSSSTPSSQPPVQGIELLSGMSMTPQSQSQASSAGQQLTGQPGMGQHAAGQPMGQPMMGQPMMGQPMMGQPMMGQSMMGQQQQYHQPMMGQQQQYQQPMMGQRQPNMGGQPSPIGAGSSGFSFMTQSSSSSSSLLGSNGTSSKPSPTTASQKSGKLGFMGSKQDDAFAFIADEVAKSKS